MLPLCVESQKLDRPIHIIAYGVLCGGFLTDKWLGAVQPQQPPAPSMGKYLALLREFGSWELFQELLQTCRRIADEFGKSTTIAQVAIAWVKAQPGVGGVIIGARHPAHVAVSTLHRW